MSTEEKGRLSWLAAGLLIAGCGPTTASESFSAKTDDLSGCHGVASHAIPASGNYYLTTFGGPTEPQSLACGGNSNSGDWYYAASEQRYGCGSHIQIQANGKCVVAQTADYGPDVCVESAAGRPIIDASPLVGKWLFGEADLGWSDRAAIHVTQVPTSVPVGPCSALEVSPDAGPPAVDAGSPVPPDAGPPDSGAVDTPPDAGPPDSGAPDAGQVWQLSCTSDGDCNPGSDGSGMICVHKVCVPGCNANWECPGDTTCVRGACK